MGNKVKYNLKNVHAAKLNSWRGRLLYLRKAESYPRRSQSQLGCRG